MMSPILSSLSNSSSGPKPRVSSRISRTSRWRSLRLSSGFSVSQRYSTTPLISFRSVLGSISAMRFISSRSTNRMWMCRLSVSNCICAGSASLTGSIDRGAGAGTGAGGGVVAEAPGGDADPWDVPSGAVGESAAEGPAPWPWDVLGPNGARPNPRNMDRLSSQELEKSRKESLAGLGGSLFGLGPQLAGHLEEDLVRAASLADLGDRHAPDPRSLEDLGRIGDLPGDRHLQGLLGLLDADLGLDRAGAVGHQLDAFGQAIELLEQAEQPRAVAQAGQIELDDDQDHVRHLEGREVGRLESLAGVDHHGRERGLEQAE